MRPGSRRESSYEGAASGLNSTEPGVSGGRLAAAPLRKGSVRREVQGGEVSAGETGGIANGRPPFADLERPSPALIVNDAVLGFPGHGLTGFFGRHGDLERVVRTPRSSNAHTALAGQTAAPASVDA